jgi:hypothetical protein
MNPFTDNIMGNWKIDKKGSSKTQLCYRREAKITLHKDHAQDYIDPKTFKNKKVYGIVNLVETKMIDLSNSHTQLFHKVELTPSSEMYDVIPAG